jgi:hypothetical protein
MLRSDPGRGRPQLSLQSLARSGATLVGRPLTMSDETLMFDDSCGTAKYRR